MAYKLYKTLILILALGVISVPAFAQYTSKDSFDYLKDDGIFSDEEKDAEAELVKQQCDRSVSEQQYFDCACLAGAFRLKRDEEKLIPQNKIMHGLLNSDESNCVDTAKIAGGSYLECKEMASFIRPRGEDTDEYCKCVGNTVAKNFSLKPHLRLNYIGKIKVAAMRSCNIRPLNPNS